jgi:pullulanase
MTDDGRRVVGDRRRRRGGLVLPLRGRGVRAVHRRGRDQPGHRPVLAVAAMNSTRSQIVDLDDPALLPPAGTSVKPPLADPRTCRSTSCTCATSRSRRDRARGLRGTFAAFTDEGTPTACPPAALADAGPQPRAPAPPFDIATIDEDASPAGARPGGARRLPARLDRAAGGGLGDRDLDGFNWGYDPWHYTDARGLVLDRPRRAARIVEFREMVMVAQRHRAAGGDGRGVQPHQRRRPGDKSVLDRIVPGYYHRLDEAGNVETSTCCPNTATEHEMMEQADDRLGRSRGRGSTRSTASAST